MKFSAKKILKLFSEILIFILAVSIFSCDHLMDDLDAAAVLVRENEILRINHYYQNLDDDDYTFNHNTYIFPVEAGTSTTDLVTPFTKNKTGFTALPFEEKTIQRDQETVVDVYYNRNIHTVSYEDNLDGEDCTVPSSSDYRFDKVINVNFTDIGDPENFKYWSTKPDGTGDIYKSDETTSFHMPDKDVTLYAMWKGVASYTVRYFKQNLEDDDYLVDPDEEETLHGKVGFLTTAVIKDFEGFTTTATSAAAIQQIIQEDGSTVINIYYNRNLHDVTYDKNCTDSVSVPAAMTSVPYETDINVDFTVSSRLGYTFAGWNTASDGSGTAYTQGTLESFILGDADITLYAQWIPTTVDGNGITISFPTISATTETLTIAITEEKAGSSTPWNISSGPITLDAGTSIKFAISPTGTYDNYYWIWDGTPESITTNSKTIVSTNFTIGTHNLIIYLENSTTHESAMGQVTFIVAE